MNEKNGRTPVLSREKENGAHPEPVMRSAFSHQLLLKTASAQFIESYRVKSYTPDSFH